MTTSADQALSSPVRLTQYSHGAGCGCKIAPAVLAEILRSATPMAFPGLLVGNEHSDDAAVFDLGDGTGIVSTTDFFMPIVDDPATFGRIAATNAISDVYAMGGTPLMAIAILGWPINKLDTQTASAVLEGGRAACRDAGIPLAGGHSIDAPEPIFGLAVTGRVALAHLKRNHSAEAGDRLYLTKPLGVGAITTAAKKGAASAQAQAAAIEVMCQLNSVGKALGELAGVTAMTDVTGFGLAGHLLEMCRPGGLCAVLDVDALPVLPAAVSAIEAGHSPGGTTRNLQSVAPWLAPMSVYHQALLCDPQTSGGLLVAVRPEAAPTVEALLREHGLCHQSVGELASATGEPLVRLAGT